MEHHVKQQLELLQEFFPGALIVPIQKLAPVVGMARQTARNRASSGTLPFPTVKVGGSRCARLLDVAGWLASFDQVQPKFLC